MDIRNNTILITGGSSGIGRGLAEAFHAVRNRVIIAGRHMDTLRAVADSNPGMQTLALDLQVADSIRIAARRVAASFPDLNVLINDGGIQKAENLLDEPFDLTDMSAEIAINLVGQIRLTAELLPLLRKQERSTIINVTSGLAFVPMAAVPTYCATKAAMHSYTMSLRYQLRETSMNVIEIVPPQTQTNLRPGYSHDPKAMPLPEFIGEVMAILQSEPDTHEVVVERAKAIRFAVERGTFDQVFATFNPRA
jgi:uncharacterized oxidoreductase